MFNILVTWDDDAGGHGSSSSNGNGRQTNNRADQVELRAKMWTHNRNNKEREKVELNAQELCPL